MTYRPDGSAEQVPLLYRIDTTGEVGDYRNGGILHYALTDLVEAA